MTHRTHPYFYLLHEAILAKEPYLIPVATQDKAERLKVTLDWLAKQIASSSFSIADEPFGHLHVRVVLNKEAESAFPWTVRVSYVIPRDSAEGKRARAIRNSYRKRHTAFSEE